MTGRHETSVAVRLEPAVILGTLQAVLALIASLWIGLSPTRLGAIMALATAIVAVGQGLSAGPFHWPLIVGAVQAGLALILAFGFHVSTDTQGAILAVVAALGGLFTRQLVTPTIRAVPGVTP